MNFCYYNTDETNFMSALRSWEGIGRLKTVQPQFSVIPSSVQGMLAHS